MKPYKTRTAIKTTGFVLVVAGTLGTGIAVFAGATAVVIASLYFLLVGAAFLIELDE